MQDGAPASVTSSPSRIPAISLSRCFLAPTTQRRSTASSSRSPISSTANRFAVELIGLRELLAVDRLCVVGARKHLERLIAGIREGDEVTDAGAPSCIDWHCHLQVHAPVRRLSARRTERSAANRIERRFVVLPARISGGLPRVRHPK